MDNREDQCEQCEGKVMRRGVVVMSERWQSRRGLAEFGGKGNCNVFGGGSSVDNAARHGSARITHSLKACLGRIHMLARKLHRVITRKIAKS